MRELGAVGSFIRPNLVNGHYWHSNYWEPLYSIHEELNVTWGFHEGTGAWYSYFNQLYGENRFYRHVASHWIEMQQALVAMIIGGVLRVPSEAAGRLPGSPEFLGAGLLSRIEWDYPQYRDSHARISRSRRASTSGATAGRRWRSEPEIEATAGLIGADRMCISTDYPHFDSNFPYVSTNLLKNVPREIAAQIFMGGATLYAFSESIPEGRQGGGNARRQLSRGRTSSRAGPSRARRSGSSPVLTLGTSYFAASNTGPLVLPFLKSLAPSASTAKLHAIHMVLQHGSPHRVRGARAALVPGLPLADETRPAPPHGSALAVCLVCAIADEAHQATIPERYGSARDVVIDVSGAAGALLIARGRMAARERAPGAQPDRRRARRMSER